MSESHSGELLQRLRRRVQRLEAELALLVAEIDAAAMRLEPSPEVLKEQLGGGRPLEFGVEHLFAPSERDPARPVEAYERLTERCWFGFDAQRARPDLRVWSVASAGEPSGRRKLVVALRERGGADWLLMEFQLDWNEFGDTRRLLFAVLGSAEPTVQLDALLYAETAEGEALRTGPAALHLNARPGVTVAEIEIPHEFLRNADRNRTLMLHVGFRDLQSARFEFQDLRLSALDGHAA